MNHVITAGFRQSSSVLGAKSLVSEQSYKRLLCVVSINIFIAMVQRCTAEVQLGCKGICSLTKLLDIIKC